MAEEAALRTQLDEQRNRIGYTVDQIEDRVRPGRIAQRQRGRMKERLATWKEAVMGSDEYEYRGGNGHEHHRFSDASESVRERASSAASTITDTPEMVRRRTRGNPAAPGLIAFGAGLLVASVAPTTRREERAMREMQPQLERAATELGDAGREVAEEVQHSARDAAEEVKETASQAASEVAGEGRDAVRREK
jgi:gas vesicle protein